MKYLIAAKVIYDSECGELTVHDSEEPESRKLTDTANRILSLLVASHGEVVEREFLLRQVWELAGHVSSSASLNQYISILRKALTSFTDIEETIIVVPKVGFYFSSDIDVQAMKPPEDPATYGKGDAVARMFRPFSTAYLWAILVIVLLLASNFWLMIQPNSTARYTRLVDIGKLENCNLYAYKTVTSNIQKRLVGLLNIVEPTLKEKCRDHTGRVMVDVQPGVLFGSRGRVFHSFCLIDNEDNKAIYCDNFYAFNWKMK
jgi:DNA-binding winged-HTH domains